MKILKYLSLCAVLLALASCTSPEQRAVVRLAEAEKLTWAYPDSALQLLQPIPSLELLTGSLQADYALLLSHLQHRCEKPASDSLTNLAWNHYKENADKDRRGKAWYMKGIVAEEYGKAADEVLSYYRQAEECATEMKDKYMVRALYNRMGRLYRRMWTYVQPSTIHSIGMPLSKRNIKKPRAMPTCSSTRKMLTTPTTARKKPSPYSNGLPEWKGLIKVASTLL